MYKILHIETAEYLYIAKERQTIKGHLQFYWKRTAYGSSYYKVYEVSNKQEAEQDLNNLIEDCKKNQTDYTFIFEVVEV